MNPDPLSINRDDEYSVMMVTCLSQSLEPGIIFGPMATAHRYPASYSAGDKFSQRLLSLRIMYNAG